MSIKTLPLWLKGMTMFEEEPAPSFTIAAHNLSSPRQMCASPTDAVSLLRTQRGHDPAFLANNWLFASK